MTGFTQSKTMVGWGLNWKLKVSRFSGYYGCMDDWNQNGSCL